MKITINEWLYKKLWENKKRSMLKKIIYIIIPWILLAILYSIIFLQGAGTIEGGYGFWLDKTNVFVLPYMFLFSYYIGGWNSTYLNRNIRFFINKIEDINDKNRCEKILKSIDKKKTIINWVSAFFVLFGLWFVHIADLNETNNWYSLLSESQLNYYRFFVIATWYVSANVLFDTIVSARKIYRISHFRPKIDIANSDNCAGLSKIFTQLFWNVGLAFYFVVSVAIIIYSDFTAYKYNVENAFYKYPVLIIPIVLLLILYFSFTIIPLIECRRIIFEKIESESANINISRSEIEKINNSMFYSIKNVFVFLCANILYLISIIKEIL